MCHKDGAGSGRERRAIMVVPGIIHRPTCARGREASVTRLVRQVGTLLNERTLLPPCV